MIRYDMMPTDQGKLLVAIDERGLVHVDFLAGLRPLPDMQDWQQDGEALAPFLAEFRDYFAGRLQRFTLPLAPRGRRFSKRCGRRCATSPTGRPAATATSPAPSASQTRCGRWVPRTAAIRSPSSSPATG